MSAQKPFGNDGIHDGDDAPSTGGYAAAGLQFAVALVLFALGGDWLDDRFGTAPLFLLLGVFGGGAAAFYSMYRKLMGPHGRKPDKQ